MSENIEVKDLYKVIKKQRQIIFKCFLLAVIVATIVSFIIPPTYEAETTVRIKKDQGLSSSIMDELPLGNNGATKQQMATYAEIIKSRGVVQGVIDKALAGQENPPSFEEMRSRITTQALKDTELLLVKVKGKSPEEAQYLANTLVNIFMERMTSLARSEQSAVRVFIGERLQDSKKELEKAETALEKYKREQKIIAPDAETKSMVDRMAAVNAMQAENAVNIASSQAKLSSLRQQIAREDPGFIADSPLIQQYKSKLAELEVQLVSLRETYTDKHPQVIATKAAIAETKTKLNNEVAHVINSEAPSMNPVHQGMVQEKIQSEAEIAAAGAQRQAISGIIAKNEQELAKLPNKEKGFARLEREAMVSQQIYTMLAQRYEEARISEVMQPTDVQIVDVAVAPAEPVSPKKVINIIIGALLGVCVGVAIAMYREFVNKTISNTEDVKEYLNLPVLGSIPDYSSNEAEGRKFGLWNRVKVGQEV